MSWSKDDREHSIFVSSPYSTHPESAHSHVLGLHILRSVLKMKVLPPFPPFLPPPSPFRVDRQASNISLLNLATLMQPLPPPNLSHCWILKAASCKTPTHNEPGMAASFYPPFTLPLLPLFVQISSSFFECFVFLLFFSPVTETHKLEQLTL